MDTPDIVSYPVRPLVVWLLVPIPMLILAVVALSVLDIGEARESAILVAAFNAFFCSAPSVIIAFLAGRDYLASGSPTLLLIGPAALVLGLAFLLGGSLVSTPNWAATIQNGGILVAGALFGLSGLSALLQRDETPRTFNRRLNLALIYIGTLVFIGLLTTLAVTGFVPAFLREGQEVTMARQFVLALAAGCFLVAYVMFVYLYRRRHERFLLLCGGAFALIAVSLATLAVTRAMGGSAVSWVSRSGQWVAGVYLVVAVFSLADRSIWILPLERNLRELEERYRTLVEMSPDPIIVDADGRYLFANLAAARIVGLGSPKEMVGREVAEFVVPECLDLVAARRQQALSGEQSSPQEIRLKRTDGTTVDVETMDRRVKFQGRFAAQVIMRDITERKQTEEVMRVSEERYRLLARENERLYRQQLDIAESLQLALLNIPSEIGRVRLGHLYRSATEAALVGGDFYDAFQVKNGHVAVLIGDVAGHGIEAARTATLVKDVVHAFTHQSLRPHEVLRRTNRLLVEKDLPGFVTLFLGIIDSATGRLRFCSAGHPQTLLRRNSGLIEPLGAGSYPLGVHNAASWKQAELTLEPGDVLLLYTDGVIEARQGLEFFGQERLKSLLMGGRILVDRFPQYVLDQVMAFSGGTLKDDVAILAVSLVNAPVRPMPPNPFRQESLLN